MHHSNGQHSVETARAFPPILSFLPFFCLIIALLFLQVHLPVQLQLGDEGVTSVDAWRLLRGEIPHRDYFEIIPPLSAFFLAGAYKCFGLTHFASRLLAGVYGVLLVLAIWKLGRLYLKTPLARAFPLALLAPFGVGLWPLPSHHWLVDLCLLGAFLAFLAAYRRNSPFFAILGGICCSGAILSLQDQGGYAVIVLVAVTVWAIWKHKLPLRLPAYAAGGLILALAGAVVPLALWAGAGTLFYDWVVFPATRYQEIPGNFVGIGAGFRDVMDTVAAGAWQVAPFYTAFTVLNYLVLFLVPFLAVAGLALSLWKRWLPPLESVLLSAFTLAFLGSILHRWSLMNIAWGASLPALATALLLDGAALSPRPWLRRTVTTLGGFAVVCLIGFSLLRIPVARGANLQYIETPRGTLAVFNPHQASNLREFVAASATLVPSGEPAFILGYLPLAGFLTDHPNPTPYTIFIYPGYNTESQAQKWLQSLEAGKVHWGFSNRAQFALTDPAYQAFSKRFAVRWSNSEYMIWERRSPAGADTR